MSLSLEEALSQVDLEVGKTYQCRVNGRLVMVKVVDALSPSSAGIDESDIMMEPWVTLPRPKTTGVRVKAKPGKMPLPSVPEIPREEE